jgi:integrase
MADIIDLMLATGARIGEILAVRWTDVDLDAARPSLTINETIKTEPGKGTYRKPTPKSDSSVRTVVLPDSAVAVLRRRHEAAKEKRKMPSSLPGTAPGSKSATSSVAGGRSGRTPAWTG